MIGAGLTLGGGLGWIARKHGPACDNLLSAHVVTADGEQVTASADENPDLLWALRGGGGNFGVVTSFEYRLHPIGPEVIAGGVVHSFADAPEVFRFFSDYVASAPDAPATYQRLAELKRRYDPDNVFRVNQNVAPTGR